ncbi:MAG: hypothetical protein ABJB74_03110 [Gemmatimonas sp.]
MACDASGQLSSNAFACDTLIVDVDKNVLVVGEKTHLNYHLAGRDGLAAPCPLLLPKVLAFSSTNPGVATVTENSDVLAIAPGTAKISITIGTRTSAPVSIQVIAP